VCIYQQHRQRTATQGTTRGMINQICRRKFGAMPLQPVPYRTAGWRGHS
jgi:hypothetical protein